MADFNPNKHSNEIEKESSIIDVTNTESDEAVNPTTTIHLDNDDKEIAANSDVVGDRGGDDGGGDDDDGDDDDDDDDADDDDDGEISEGREESDGGDDDNNNGGDNEDVEDNSNNVENSIGDNELATADNNKTYSPLKVISAKFKEGPFKENSKFKAYQKMDIGGGAEGLYYFGAQVLMENEEDSSIEGSLIEYADMFEGGFFFLACAYSTHLDDLQFIFLKQSWYEKCPASDEYEGNFSNVRGYYK